MSEAGLLNAADPVPPETPVTIRFSVEAGGQMVYTEVYDVDTLADEFSADEPKVIEAWTRRLLCTIASRSKPGFAAALTRCLNDGCCCDNGHEACDSVDEGRGGAAAIEELVTATEEKSPKVENL